MKYLFILFAILIIVSCAGVKTTKDINPLTIKKGMRHLNLKGNFSTTFPGLQQSLQFSLKLAEKDSLKFEVFGPMGMIVGRLFATPNRFLFYNVITSEAFTGTPSAKNLNLAMNLPLSYSDFVSFLRCEPAQAIETFVLDSSYSSDGKVLFMSVQKGFVDYVLVRQEDNHIVQQQRKLVDGKVLLNVFYDEYNAYDGFNIASSIKFNFPKLSGTVFVNNSNVKINEEYVKPFNFAIPSSVKIRKFD